MNDIDRLEAEADILDDAFHHTELAIADLGELPDDPGIDKQLMIGTAEDLMELISKTLEEIGSSICVLEDRERRELMRESYKW